MIHRLVDVFKEWQRGPLSMFRFADPTLYSLVNGTKSHHSSLNQYIKTEADISSKFGGYLEERLLLASNASLTVHAELNVYEGQRRQCADLSVHNVSPGILWIDDNPDLSLQTVKAVIEVKYA